MPLTAFQAEVCRAALKEMFANGHFSICVVDQILKMTGGVPEAQDYEALRALHCLDFKAMSPVLRVEFQRALERVLSSPEMRVEVSFAQNVSASRMIEL